MRRSWRRRLPASRRQDPTAYYAKGNYFTSPPLAFLAPDLSRAGGRALGVHITVDLGGQAKFGPTSNGSTLVMAASLHRRSAPCDKFYAAVRKYWPAIKDVRCSGLCRHPAQDRASRCTGAGFHDPGWPSTVSQD